MQGAQCSPKPQRRLTVMAAWELTLGHFLVYTDCLKGVLQLLFTERL